MLSNGLRLSIHFAQRIGAIVPIDEQRAPAVGGRKDEHDQALGHDGGAANNGPQIGQNGQIDEALVVDDHDGAVAASDVLGTTYLERAAEQTEQLAAAPSGTAAMYTVLFKFLRPMDKRSKLTEIGM